MHAEVGGLPRGAAIEALAVEPTEARVHPSRAGDHREARALELAAVLARHHHLIRAGPPEGKRAVVGAVSLVHHHAPLLQRTLAPPFLPQEVRHILLLRRIALGRPTLWLKQSRHAREGVPRRGEGRVVGCMPRLVAREYAEAKREARGDARELGGSSDEARVRLDATILGDAAEGRALHVLALDEHLDGELARGGRAPLHLEAPVGQERHAVHRLLRPAEGEREGHVVHRAAQRAVHVAHAHEEGGGHAQHRRVQPVPRRARVGRERHASSWLTGEVTGQVGERALLSDSRCGELSQAEWFRSSGLR